MQHAHASRLALTLSLTSLPPTALLSVCGAQVLLEFVGRDATGAFVGVGHSMAAQRMLARFQVGVLHPKDVIRIGAPF